MLWILSLPCTKIFEILIHSSSAITSAVNTACVLCIDGGSIQNEKYEWQTLFSVVNTTPHETGSITMHDKGFVMVVNFIAFRNEVMFDVEVLL